VGGPLPSPTATTGTRAVPLVGVGAGTYDLAVTYTLQGTAGSADFAAYCRTTGMPASTQSSAPVNPTLAAGSHVVSLPLRCPVSTIWFEMKVEASTTLVIDRLSLTKTASG
jgi:hypothetical protein